MCERTAYSVGSLFKRRIEGILWQAAIASFGENDLYNLVLKLLNEFEPKPTQGLLEHLLEGSVGTAVVALLERALVELGLGRPESKIPDHVSLFSCYSRHLANGLLHAVPMSELPISLRGLRLEDDLGI